MYYWLFFILKVFYDQNISLKVKIVNEKFSEFKIIVSDTSRVFYAIFPCENVSFVCMKFNGNVSFKGDVTYFSHENMVICIFSLLKMSQSPSHSDYIKSGHVLLL